MHVTNWMFIVAYVWRHKKKTNRQPHRQIDIRKYDCVMWRHVCRVMALKRTGSTLKHICTLQSLHVCGCVQFDFWIKNEYLWRVPFTLDLRQDTHTHTVSHVCGMTDVTHIVSQVCDMTHVTHSDMRRMAHEGKNVSVLLVLKAEWMFNCDVDAGISRPGLLWHHNTSKRNESCRTY